MSSASQDFEPFVGERPEAGRVKDWLRLARTKLSNDEVALLNGAEAPSLIAYRDVQVPPALVAGGDVTANMVENRVVTRLTKQDENAQRQALRASKTAEIQQGLFVRIEASLLETAPLLLARLKRDHVLAPPFAHWYDGIAAWGVLAAMEDATQMLPGEAQDHDAELIALALKPLSDEATPSEFATRVDDALRKHIPFLERPFANTTAESR